MFQDLLYGLRMIRRNPGVMAVATLTLALGIGANTAMFSVIDATLLRSLPYKDPDRLVTIWAKVPALNLFTGHVEYQIYAESWRDQSRSFESMSAFTSDAVNLTSGDEAERVEMGRVNAPFFGLHGIRPAAGRDFTVEDDRPGAAPVIILSHELWQRRFGSDPGIISRPLVLDGKSYTVIGVLPPKFRSLAGAQDLYTPMAESTGPHNPMSTVCAYARLKPGVQIESAQAELDTICRRVVQQRTRPKSWGGIIWSIRDFETRRFRSSIIMLGVAVGLVLLIACANVANLLLARAAARQKEIAIRSTMGAGRFRIVRQLLTESLLVGGFGGVAGLLFGYGLVRALPLAGPQSLTFLKEISVNAPVLGFTLAVALLTTLLFGAAPALASARAEIAENLKETGRGAGESLRHGRFRAGLAIVQVALALLLLVGSTLTLRSLLAVEAVRPGFNAEGVLTASITLPSSGYSGPAQRAAFYRRLVDRLETMPGIKSVGIGTNLPFSGSKSGVGLFAEGFPPTRREEVPILFTRVVDAKYFPTIQATLRRGRYFTEQDPQGPAVAIINETMARRLWPGRDPLGKRFGDGLHWITVVGVIGDMRHMSLTEEPDSEFFVEYGKNPRASMSLVIRTASDPMRMAPALRAAVQEIDKSLPVSRVASLAQSVSDSMGVRRFSVALFGIFALLALVLAAVGIYGLISYSVSRRTHEMGVRMALGAESGQVLRMVVGQALLLATGGVLLGIGGGLALTRLMRTMLYGVSPTDPMAFAGASAFLLAVAALAGYVPARRAARVDPMIALREE